MLILICLMSIIDTPSELFQNGAETSEHRFDVRVHNSNVGDHLNIDDCCMGMTEPSGLQCMTSLPHRHSRFSSLTTTYCIMKLMKTKLATILRIFKNYIIHQ